MRGEQEWEVLFREANLSKIKNGLACCGPVPTGKATAMAHVTGKGPEADGQGSFPGRLETSLKVLFEENTVMTLASYKTVLRKLGA